MDENAIHALVARLARPRPAGGASVERAAVVAEGADASEVIAWIIARGGAPEERGSAGAGGGLHGGRFGSGVRDAPKAPLRYVLPAGLLDSNPDPKG